MYPACIFVADCIREGYTSLLLPLAFEDVDVSSGVNEVLARE